MHRSIVALLGGMIVALAACSDESPVTPGLSPAPTPSATASAALGVTLWCEEGGRCYAEASGGSGTGYSFTWTNAYESYDQYGSSEAWPTCDGSKLTIVRARVTDSSGASAESSYTYFCWT